MKKITCFAIIPSNRLNERTELLTDSRYGLVEFPSDCKGAKSNSLSLNFDDVYEQLIMQSINAINNKIEKYDLQIESLRAVDLPLTGDIIGQLIRYICTSEITITDITANNPNVFLEYGIRLAVKDELNIMLCHQNSIIPFDVEKLRCIRYSMDLKEANEAKDKIVSFISNYIENNFILEKKQPLETKKISDFEDYSFFKNLIDIHTGLKHNEKLLITLLKSPQLIASMGSFLFTNEKPVGLKQELFQFFNTLENIYRIDPSGHHNAISLLEMMTQIKGIDKERLQDIYYKLWELCDIDPNLKDKAESYLNQYKKSEE